MFLFAVPVCQEPLTHFVEHSSQHLYQGLQVFHCGCWACSSPVLPTLHEPGVHSVSLGMLARELVPRLSCWTLPLPSAAMVRGWGEESGLPSTAGIRLQRCICRHWYCGRPTRCRGHESLWFLHFLVFLTEANCNCRR